MKRLLVLGLCYVASIASMQKGDYTYRLAHKEDIQQMLGLMKIAESDCKQVVILPNKFREGALLQAIEKKRMFIAEDKNNNIIGYKKLFLIKDNDEKNSMLKDELRCVGQNAECIYTGNIETDGSFIDKKLLVPIESYYTTCIYDGGDFTHPDYRGKGINSTLTNVGLELITSDIQKHIEEHPSSAITMLYGITQSNAGTRPGIAPDRSMSIAKSLRCFLNNFNEFNPNLEHYRFKAFMPTFDFDSDVCKPLPDEQSVPGFGCLLVSLLRGSHE